MHFGLRIGVWQLTSAKENNSLSIPLLNPEILCLSGVTIISIISLIKEI